MERHGDKFRHPGTGFTNHRLAGILDQNDEMKLPPEVRTHRAQIIERLAFAYGFNDRKAARQVMRDVDAFNDAQPLAVRIRAHAVLDAVAEQQQ
jgi:hypothetical protein